MKKEIWDALFKSFNSMPDEEFEKLVEEYKSESNGEECYDPIVDTYHIHGKHYCMFMTMEELSEVQKAISKLARYEIEHAETNDFDSNDPKYIKLKDDLAEEMADVLICSKLMQVVFDISDEQIENVISEKEKRQINRIKEHYVKMLKKEGEHV